MKTNLINANEANLGNEMAEALLNSPKVLFQFVEAIHKSGIDDLKTELINLVNPDISEGKRKIAYARAVNAAMYFHDASENGSFNFFNRVIGCELSGRYIYKHVTDELLDELNMKKIPEIWKSVLDSAVKALKIKGN